MVKREQAAASPASVCMHVLGAVRNDARVMREASALVEEGLTVFTVDVEGNSGQPLEEEIRGVQVKHLIMPASFATTRFRKHTLMRAAMLFMRSVWKLIQTPADFYHAHDEAALPACFVASVVRRKRLIFDAHELPLDETSIRWPWLKKLFSILLAFILPRCTGIITVSTPIAQEIRRRYHTSEVTVVRNILPYKHVPRNDLVRQILRLGPHVRVALYQGNLQANRGLDGLIRAAAFLDPAIVIVMMGKGSAAELAKLAAILAEVGLPERVKILPAVPYAELLNWTASADIGLIVNPPEISLNVQWCLPNKFFEYLMAGLPVLSSSLDVVGDVIRTYDVGRVMSSSERDALIGREQEQPTLTPLAIGQAINTMLTDSQALARMRHNALAVVKDEFCWERERYQLIHLYQRMLANVGAGLAPARLDPAQVIRVEPD